MELFLLVLSKANPFVSFKLFPAFCISHSMVLFSGCSWSTPLPCTLRVLVQCVSTVPCGFHSVWPIQYHFLSFICRSVGVLCHNFSFGIFSCHLTFKVLWHQFTNIWSELLASLVIFHVSHPYNRTNLTFVLNNCKLVLTILFLQTGYNSMKAPLLS